MASCIDKFEKGPFSEDHIARLIRYLKENNGPAVVKFLKKIVSVTGGGEKRCKYAFRLAWSCLCKPVIAAILSSVSLSTIINVRKFYYLRYRPIQVMAESAAAYSESETDFLESIQIIELLVKRGANVDGIGFYEDDECYDPRCDEQYTALYHAVWWRNVNLTKCLLRLGANVNLQERDFDHGYLTYACDGSYSKPNIAIIDALIEGGVDVRGYEGQEAMMYAAATGCTDVVDHLLSLGARREQSDDYYTPLVAAVSYGKCGLFAPVFLRRNNERIKAGLEIINILVKKGGANVNAKSLSGNYVLHEAAGTGEFIDLLIHYGADDSNVNRDGHTVYEMINQSSALKPLYAEYLECEAKKRQASFVAFLQYLDLNWESSQVTTSSSTALETDGVHISNTILTLFGIELIQKEILSYL